MLHRASKLLDEAVKKGRIAGAALGAIELSGEREVYCSGVKHFERGGDIGPESYFDLASLTKVLFTVPQLMKTVEEGLVDLDDPISRFLPEIAWMQDSELPSRTLRQLLTHTSGLPAWEPVYTWGTNVSTLKQRILQTRWEMGPVGQERYSDLGYMLLGFILERLRGRPLVAFELPVGLLFNPKNQQDCAATEQCPWRGRILQGEVHDENAFALGGVAGHAGMFGSLNGVLRYAGHLMKGQVLSPAAMAEMRRSQTGDRAIGWNTMGSGFSGGSLCSQQTIGHTGFTGTGLWVDFERGYAWALLTNRVHPTRHRETGIVELRRALGNAIAGEWKTRSVTATMVG